MRWHDVVRVCFRFVMYQIELSLGAVKRDKIKGYLRKLAQLAVEAIFTNKQLRLRLGDVTTTCACA